MPAGYDDILGSMYLWPIAFPPTGYMYCQGQLLSITQNSALYSLLGITYGGDGSSTFALPNMSGRVPVGAGQAPGGTVNYQLAQYGGHDPVALTPAQMPYHSHTATYTPPAYTASGTVKIKAKTGMGTLVNTPQNNYMGPSGANNIYSAAATDNVFMADPNVTITVAIDQAHPGSVQIASTGGTTAFDHRMNFLVLNYLIAIEGVYPQRS